METKTCPSCGTEVPVVASRCKTCFHDFNEAPPRRSGGPMALLAAFAAMAVVGGAALYWVSVQPTDQRILVDGPSRSVQWVKQFSDGRLETDRVSFDDIAKLEYVITTTGEHEIVAITLEGDRKVIEHDADQALQLRAKTYAELMDKPLATVDQTRSFLD